MENGYACCKSWKVYATPDANFTLTCSLWGRFTGLLCLGVWLGFFFFFILSNNSLCRMAAVSAFILKLVDMSSDWSHLSDKCYCDCVLYPCSEWFLMIMPCLPRCFTLNYRCHNDRANCIRAQSSTPSLWCQCLHPSVPGIKNGEGMICKTFVLKNNVLSVIKQVIFHLISSRDYFKWKGREDDFINTFLP